MSPALSQKFRFFSFLSMLLLVYVHGYNLHERYLQPFSTVQEPMTFTAFFEYFTANGILRWRIPMLFAISGYFFAMKDAEPYGRKIGRRFRSLMVPYFLWSAIGLLIAVAFYYWTFTHDAVVRTHLQPAGGNFSNYRFGQWMSALIWPTSYQLWFLRCLFVYNLLYPLLRKGLDKIPVLLFSILTLAWLMTIGLVFMEGEGLLSFTLGIWLYRKGRDVEMRPHWFSLPIFTIIFLGVAAFKTWIAFHPVFAAPFAQGMLLNFLHKIVIASGLLVAWFGLAGLAQRAMQYNFFARFSGYAFIIYALHVPLITYLIDPVLSLTPGMAFIRLLHFLLLPVLVIAVCVGVGWLLRRFTPGAYALLTGGRGAGSSEPALVATRKKSIIKTVG